MSCGIFCSSSSRSRTDATSRPSAKSVVNCSVVLGETDIMSWRGGRSAGLQRKWRKNVHAKAAKNAKEETFEKKLFAACDLCVLRGFLTKSSGLPPPLEY